MIVKSGIGKLMPHEDVFIVELFLEIIRLQRLSTMLNVMLLVVVKQAKFFGPSEKSLMLSIICLKKLSMEKKLLQQFLVLLAVLFSVQLRLQFLLDDNHMYILETSI